MLADTDAAFTTRLSRSGARACAKAAIEDALVQLLVLERGDEQVAVEDICDRADLAQATFYARYPNKEAALLSVSDRLIVAALSSARAA